jgi:hypothetical protein
LGFRAAAANARVMFRVSVTIGLVLNLATTNSRTCRCRSHPGLVVAIEASVRRRRVLGSRQRVLPGSLTAATKVQLTTPTLRFGTRLWRAAFAIGKAIRQRCGGHRPLVHVDDRPTHDSLHLGIGEHLDSFVVCSENDHGSRPPWIAGCSAHARR